MARPVTPRRFVLWIGILVLSTAPAQAGGIFVTGHDPDFHALLGGNTAGAQHIIQKGLSYATNGSIGSILLVTDLHNPGAGYSDPRLGLTASGFTFDVADDGSAGGSVLNLGLVDFSNYSAVVVASDFGGWLRQSELDLLNARSNELIDYLNAGGGLVAFAESGPPTPGLLTHDAFGYLPFLVTSSQKNQSEIGNTVTPFGASLGLTDNDVNGNASHNIFTATGGMNVVDVDSQGQILTLAYYGRIGTGGVEAVPEPSSFALSAISLAAFGFGWSFRRWNRTTSRLAA